MDKVLERSEATKLMRMMGDMAGKVEGFSVGKVSSTFDPFTGEVSVRIKMVKSGCENTAKRATEIYSYTDLRVGDLAKIAARPGVTYRVDRFLRTGNVVIEDVATGKKFRGKPSGLQKVEAAPAMTQRTATGAAVGEVV